MRSFNSRIPTIELLEAKYLLSGLLGNEELPRSPEPPSPPTASISVQSSPVAQWDDGFWQLDFVDKPSKPQSTSKPLLIIAEDVEGEAIIARDQIIAKLGT